jgi:hypothetical protein
MFKYVLCALTLITHLSLFADISTGENLERKYWASIKNHKWDDLANMTAPYCQSVTFDKVLNKDQNIAVAKSLNVGDYKMDDFKVTEGPNTLIVTYVLATTETIDGNTLTSKANRLSIWQNTNNNWQMIAHASLIPVVPPKAK